MPRVGQGATAPFTSDVVDGSGNPIDVTSYLLTLLDPNNSIVTDFPIALVDMTHVGTGVYRFNWGVPSDQPLGLYKAQWSGIDTDGAPVFGEEDWIVTSPGTVLFGTPGPIPDAYLASGRYKLLRQGMAFPSDIELANVAMEASAMADAFCNVPRGFSFFGGQVTNEEHRWRYPQTNMDVGERRIYPLRKPLRSVTSLHIVVSSGAEATIDPSSLVINVLENWVEVTSLSLASSSGLFGVSGWVVPIGGLANPIAQLSYSYGIAFPEYSRNMLVTNDVSGKVFQLPHGSITSDAVIVKANGIAIDTGAHPFLIDTENGWITFTGSVPSGKLTADYVHLLDPKLELATGMIMSKLLGDANLRAKGMSGLASIKANEVEISKGRSLPGALDLWATVPDAAMLLSGMRYVTIR